METLTRWMMMMRISPFGHKAVGALFRRSETYSRRSLYVVTKSQCVKEHRICVESRIYP
jgi:hypothetical protein